MIHAGKWRWPLIVGLPVVAAVSLVSTRVVRLNFEGKATLAYSGDVQNMEEELKMFRFHPTVAATFDAVPGESRRVSVRVDGHWPAEVVRQVVSAAQSCIDRSFARQKEELSRIKEQDQKEASDLEARFNTFMQDRKTLLAGSRSNTPKAQLVAKIEQLKSRRQQLIENYPSHTDIPILAKQIQDLLRHLDKPSGVALEKITDLDRQINETKLRSDYYTGRLKETEKKQLTLKPSWTLIQPVENVRWPNRVEGWPVGAGVVLGVLVLGLLVFQKGWQARADAPANGLWKPELDVLRATSDVGPRTSDAPVALEVVAPEVPADPLTAKAAALYTQWVELANILYTPAPEPPQGVLDRVGPLLQESSDFLPEGHDVMVRYLAHSVKPGDLAAHVARTVLMTLTGAQEAGVSPEHRLAMALAALFHDLAVVPRPAPVQEDVGSDVGRLSASVLHRIPGLQPALLAMVEDILIGMDEFKMDTWQNVTSGKNLEPLSKVLREIDRFEKVMQKQKARLDRRVANQ